MFAGAFMMGAKDRLLPPSIPFRFFASAMAFQLAGWAVLAWNFADIPGFVGGLGPVLGGLHLITLGVLAMTAMGAACQMLPVATRRPLGPVWAVRLSWWLFTPGVVVLCLGMGNVWMWALHAGTFLCAAGLLLFAFLAARNLMQVTDLPGLVRHVWIALASLFGLVVLGALLVFDVGQGFLGDRAAFAAAHAVLAGYGFMGNLALGFSLVLIPMFVLSKAPPDKSAENAAWASAAALASAVAGLLLGAVVPVVVAGLVGLAVLAVHLSGQRKVLAGRMRKKLEGFFHLVKGAWVAAPVSIAIGLYALFDDAGLAAPVWTVVLVFGWLTSFVAGILQRIMPFLASMHSGGNGGKPVLLSHLIAGPYLSVHAAAHGAAALLLAAAAAVGSGPLALAATLTGTVGAASFLVFGMVMMKRYRAHERG